MPGFNRQQSLGIVNRGGKLAPGSMVGRQRIERLNSLLAQMLPLQQQPLVEHWRAPHMQACQQVALIDGYGLLQVGHTRLRRDSANHLTSGLKMGDIQVAIGLRVKCNGLSGDGQVRGNQLTQIGQHNPQVCARFRFRAITPEKLGQLAAGMDLARDCQITE